jgi:hypothetical protein
VLKLDIGLAGDSPSILFTTFYAQLQQFEHEVHHHSDIDIDVGPWIV